MAIFVWESNKRFFSSNSGNELTALVNLLVVSFNMLIARSWASPSIPWERTRFSWRNRRQTIYHRGFQSFDFVFRLTVTFEFFLNRFGDQWKRTERRRVEIHPTANRGALLSLLLLPEFVRWNEIVRLSFRWMTIVGGRLRRIDLFNFDTIQFEILNVVDDRTAISSSNRLTKTSCANAW